MGFMDDLFGDSGGGIKSRDLRKLIDNLAETMVANLGQSGPVYGGQLTPGVNANTQSVFDSAGGLLGVNPQQSAAISSLLSGRGDPAGVQAYYQSQIAPAEQQFTDALKQIDGRYGNTWGTSGAHTRAVSDATANYGLGMDELLGNLVYQDRNAAADRQVQGVNASLGASQDYQSRLSSLLGIGDYQRGIQGEDIAANYNQWNAGQAYNNPWLGFLGTSLGTAQQAPPRAGLLEKGAAGFNLWKSASNPLSFI